MIPIKKGNPPPGLKALEKQEISKGSNPEEAYAELGKHPALKKTVRNTLLYEQCGKCAYCMGTIPAPNVEAGIAPIIIEHIIPRNHPEGLDVGQGLDWNNMVVTCHGNRKSAGHNNGNHDFTCDAAKGNQLLSKVDPCNPSTLTSITYKSDGTIYSQDPEVFEDLDNILNLNCPSAPHKTARYQLICHIWDDVPLSSTKQEIVDIFTSRLDTINKALRKHDSSLPAYAGVLIYEYEQIIKNLSLI